MRVDAEAIDKIYDESPPTGSPRSRNDYAEQMELSARLSRGNYSVVMAEWKIGPVLDGGQNSRTQALRDVTLTAIRVAQLAY